MLAAALFFLQPDYPDSPASFRQFLTEEEGRLMTDRLPPSAPRSTDKVFDGAAMLDALKSPVTHCFALMCVNLHPSFLRHGKLKLLLIRMLFEQTGTLGYNFWLPTSTRLHRPATNPIHL